jgi:hypothetical protein
MGSSSCFVQPASPLRPERRTRGVWLFMNSNYSENWVTMYRGDQGDFSCVAGFCPTQTIGKTHYPS